MPLYSSPCTNIPIGYPLECSPQQIFRFRNVVEDTALTLKIAPNPLHTVLIIENLIPKQLFQIIDISGEIIQERIAEDYPISLNLESLQPGVYFLKTLNRLPVRFIKMQ